MKALIWSLGVASMVLAAPPAAGAATTRAIPSDIQLKSRIEHRFAADTTLKRDHIDVDVNHRVVTLSGHVNSRADERRAERLARTRGIVRVDDRLSVHTRGTSGFIHRTERGVAGTTGTLTSKTERGLSKSGEVISDGWITGHVKTRFVGEDSLKGSHINVDTNEHVVTLKGTVPSAAGRARAVELARSTDGVHGVVDDLVIARH
jgi:hyperosmotically inducible protein